MTMTISRLAIDLAKGSFQVCAIGADEADLYNRVLSRTRLMTLLAEQSRIIGGEWRCRMISTASPNRMSPDRPGDPAQWGHSSASSFCAASSEDAGF